MLGVSAGAQGPEGRSLMVLSGILFSGGSLILILILILTLLSTTPTHTIQLPLTLTLLTPPLTNTSPLPNHHPGLASLVAGALSMALGEYVSVYSQRDAEEADIRRERSEFLKSPESWVQEEKELALIYQERGLSARLAAEVARELHHAKHIDEVVKIHARDELGIDTEDLSNPIQAAILSALTFAMGATIPMLAGSFVDQYLVRILLITIISSVGLFAFGAIGAVVGGAPFLKAAFRVLIGGWIAMAGTYGIGKLFGAVTVG